MHIWANLKNFLYDSEDFIAYFNEQLYFYNFIKIKTITATKVVLNFKNYQVIVIGSNLVPQKCLAKELVLKGNIESVDFK
jgi:hypothetical protein